MIRKLMVPLTIALIACSFVTAQADEPVRVALTDQATAPAIRQAPAVRVARLVRTITSQSNERSREVPVFRDEAEYIATTNLPHAHLGWLSNRHGYQPGCCDEIGYTDGLWANYCETRPHHWMHGTWFQRRFYGDCGDCDSGCTKGKTSTGKCSAGRCTSSAKQKK